MSVRFALAALLLPAASALAGGNFLMAGLGDSISAATFADGHANADSAPPEEGPGERALDGTGPGTRVWIPFIGNSENKKTWSFVSGKKIDSHYQRLSRYLTAHGDASLTVLNVAVPGEKAEGIPAQVEKLASAMESGKYEALTYVTFLIGANDACQSTDNEAVRASLRTSYEKLAAIKQNEPIHILVSALPKIPDLARKQILEMKTVAGFTCRKLRDQMLKACPPLTDWETAAEYEERLALVAGKNRIIEEVAAESQQKYSNLDIRVSHEFWDTRIEPEFLAADCFHPDGDGHELLAEKLWKDQPWFH